MNRYNYKLPSINCRRQFMSAPDPVAGRVCKVKHLQDGGGVSFLHTLCSIFGFILFYFIAKLYPGILGW